jgi:hypothetical protein
VSIYFSKIPLKFLLLLFDLLKAPLFSRRHASVALRPALLGW